MARLDDANLFSSSLSDCDLTGAKLHRARLEDATIGGGCTDRIELAVIF
jgi:uncharacterized protein YjbI with pentapeptide repeats